MKINKNMLTVTDLLMYKYCARKLFIMKALGQEYKDIVPAKYVKEKKPDHKTKGIRLRSPGLETIGKVDEIRFEKDKAVPVQNKKGKAPKQGVWKRDQLQMAYYMLMAQEKYKKQSRYGIVKYRDIARKVVMNPFLKREAIKTAKQAKEMLEKKKLPKKAKNKNKCQRCILKKECYSKQFMKKLMEENSGKKRPKVKKTRV